VGCSPHQQGRDLTGLISGQDRPSVHKVVVAGPSDAGPCSLIACSALVMLVKIVRLQARPIGSCSASTPTSLIPRLVFAKDVAAVQLPIGVRVLARPCAPARAGADVALAGCVGHSLRLSCESVLAATSIYLSAPRCSRLTSRGI
jgi:hypothetical protein